MTNEIFDLIIQRESVAAGDDGDAPHEIRIPTHNDETLEHIVIRLIELRYLASISGGKATWIVEAGTRPVAVVAQQWTQARYLIPATQAIRSLVEASAKCHLYFRYWCQADPELVYECLHKGEPLPSKWHE